MQNIVAQVERWAFSRPFRITGYEWSDCDVLLVEVSSGELRGRGEALGVYYHGDTPETACELLRDREVLNALPAGGARNALDCALWDLRAKLEGRPVWQLLDLESPRPIITTYTIGADEPASMAQAAREYAKARALKLKLIGDGDDAERVTAVRAARPDVWLAVDGNQGLTRESLERLAPVLEQSRVEFIEQPFPIGRDGDLDGFRSPIPIAADESAQTSADLGKLAGRFDVVNIKLDKCGGLTEGLNMLHEARRLGLRPMVGCMGGTSLSMGPAFLLGQLCEFADLDGPILFSRDREPSAEYDDEGRIFCSEAVWGGAA